MFQSDDETDINVLYGKLKELNNFIYKQDATNLTRYINDNQITPQTYSLLPWYKQSGIYPVEVATEVGNVDILNVLLSLGFSPHGLKTNPIYTACKTGNVPIVKLLIERGVNVVHIDEQTDPPHCSAIEHGKLNVVKTLIEAGASVNSPSGTCQYTYPLSHAASVGAREICSYLISKGAHVDSKDHKGRTALFQAGRHHREGACTVLLDSGADVNCRSCSGLTPFLAAVSTFYDPGESNQCRVNVMKLLVSRGANPDSVDMFGCSALHYAVHSYDVTRYLIDLNVKLDPRNDCKDATPFTMAMSKHNYAVAILLIKAGYNPVGEKCIDELDTMTGSDISEYIREIISNPRTLQEICCFKIRSILGKTLSSVIHSLPLPITMQDFLLLKHIPQTNIMHL